MSGHRHAELMAQYAEDARETETPWERWQVSSIDRNYWVDCFRHPNWHGDSAYRRKPKTSRERFEDFICDHHKLNDCFNQFPDGRYEKAYTQRHWETWQESERQARELDE